MKKNLVTDFIRRQKKRQMPNFTYDLLKKYVKFRKFFFFFTLLSGINF